MRPNNITRAIIDATVDRSLREVAEDPQRSIRKLADMGRHFSTNSGFLDDVYEIMQDLLRNDDSPYYTAIGRLLRSADRKGLKNFFINLGYNSLTFGGKIIRKEEAENDFQIPWCLVLHLNPAHQNSINAADIHHFVEQGNQLGIYTFIILLESTGTKTTDLLHIFAENTDSAFICFLPDGKLDDAQLRQMRSCTNTLFLFGADMETTEENLPRMQGQKLLAGIYGTYTDENAGEWISGKRMESLNQHNAAIAFLVPDETCSQETKLRMGQCVRKLRTQPLYPFIPFELSCDVTEIKKIVSDNACYFELLENGDILTKDDAVVEYRHTLSLQQMLSFALPAE
ncbi:MAG: hypothetical protein IJ860_03885 [Eubacterium sp.]|nr:hypothetical protein [Eubacterium sp.]